MDLMRDSMSHGLTDISAPRSVQTRLCLATVTGTDHQTGSRIRNRTDELPHVQEPPRQPQPLLRADRLPLPGLKPPQGN